MFAEITYYPVLGKPLIYWLGILAFSFFAATALTGYGMLKGWKFASRNRHYLLARLAIAVVLVHGALGFLAYV